MDEADINNDSSQLFIKNLNYLNQAKTVLETEKQTNVYVMIPGLWPTRGFVFSEAFFRYSV